MSAHVNEPIFSMADLLDGRPLLWWADTDYSPSQLAAVLTANGRFAVATF